MKCVGDREGWHPDECPRVATILVEQEDCPPGCSHPLSEECLAYAQKYGGGVFFTAVGKC